MFVFLICIALGTFVHFSFGMPVHVFFVSSVCHAQMWEFVRENDCTAYCWASGDPHYFTFDRKMFTFNGACKYILVQTKSVSNTGLPQFTITAENVPCGSSGVTCTKALTIVAYGLTFEFSGSQTLTYGDESVTLDLAGSVEIASGIQFYRAGLFVGLYFDFGLKVLSDGGELCHMLS